MGGQQSTKLSIFRSLNFRSNLVPRAMILTHFEIGSASTNQQGTYRVKQGVINPMSNFTAIVVLRQVLPDFFQMRPQSCNKCFCRAKDRFELLAVQK